MTRLWLLAVFTCVIVVACSRVPLTAPTNSTISVTIDQTTLPLNGQAQVRAIVIESAGTPVHNGTEVTFSTTLGNFNPPSASTVNGVATSTFFAGSISGTTKINAYSGGASTGSGNSSSGGVEVKIGAAAAGSVAVSATPPSVSQSGGTVTISALVLDPSNNPVPGVSVLFSSTAGSLSSTTALSDATGVAKVTLTTQTTSTVRATASGTASATVDVIVSNAPTVTIDAPGPFTENSPAAITITPATGSGNGSPRQLASIRVDFGDGTFETRNNVTGPIGLTHTYTRAGGYTITATATDVSGNTSISSKAIVVGFESRPTVSISGTPNPVSATTGTNPGVVTFTVTAAAGTGTGAPPIRSVRVTLQDGTVIYSNTGSVSSASFVYRFTVPGNYTVTATATDANGATGTSTTVIIVNP
jgi:hypothetical protein